MFRFAPNSTDVTVYFRLRDSTTGLAKTGLAYNSSGVQVSYTRKGAAAVSISPATQTVTGTHSDGGFVEVDSTKCPGLYRLDLVDAVCASGKPYAIVSVTFTGVVAESVLVNIERVPQGSGTATHTVTVNNSSTNLPISGALVWVTTDSAGAGVVASGITNGSGVVVFTLDPGDYYLWGSADGYAETNPTAITVTVS